MHGNEKEKPLKEAEELAINTSILLKNLKINTIYYFEIYGL